MAHVILKSELEAMVFQINKRLRADPDVADRLPLDPPEKVQDQARRLTVIALPGR